MYHGHGENASPPSCPPNNLLPCGSGGRYCTATSGGFRVPRWLRRLRYRLPMYNKHLFLLLVIVALIFLTWRLKRPGSGNFYRFRKLGHGGGAMVPKKIRTAVMRNGGVGNNNIQTILREAAAAASAPGGGGGGGADVTIPPFAYGWQKWMNGTVSAVPEVDCRGILKGEPDAVAKAKAVMLDAEFRVRPRPSPGDYVNMTADCVAFVKDRGYLVRPLSLEEVEFPIAYSIVIHHKIEMFERLLRAIYAPQNLYCVHVDSKSGDEFIRGVSAIARCFPNVALAHRLHDVVYGSWSRVQADLSCMSDLDASPVKWRYLLNLCGMDFPLKTNLEIVRALKALGGKNALESEGMPNHKLHRIRKRHVVASGGVVVNTGRNKAPPPLRIPIFAGNAYFAVTREFVDFVLKDEPVALLMHWFEDTYSPDEHLWATVQRMYGTPGGIPVHVKYDTSDMWAKVRFVKWHYYEGDIKKGALYPPCDGIHVHAICIFGSGDVKWLKSVPHLFANKFDDETDEFAVRCLDEDVRTRAIEVAARDARPLL
ncbi:1,3 galactose glycoprotein beta1,6 N-acetyl glucosaminyl transferase 1 [Proboscivirus elephantidbeta4]|uniref:1,3 galactose glycoprotein beta1,6 N-acetyl glucosaminyl transferase 1 n=1 Tax=Elephant endotheliotropic herpesvirus 4 TaxID=548914 RepID=A0A0S1TKJ6_9BETA|nr:1,3 galactose glycoprotein beta1,6 N-acetyl glucosaminyl transferase 1 [Elephant endotheliotropic herpesvirus 4]ALM25931.1 1,3 galactose glycoprotein beta1,6 N-acetyl glucosaminyl transferase 1 [Elephant endotheliotropic herpesvirus 4]